MLRNYWVVTKSIDEGQSEHVVTFFYSAILTREFLMPIHYLREGSEWWSAPIYINTRTVPYPFSKLSRCKHLFLLFLIRVTRYTHHSLKTNRSKILCFLELSLLLKGSEPWASALHYKSIKWCHFFVSAPPQLALRRIHHPTIPYHNKQQSSWTFMEHSSLL